jgi:hypothetical protein
MDDDNESSVLDEHGKTVGQTGKRLPMHPDVARAYIKQSAHNLVVRVAATLKAKRELADREKQGPVAPADARAFIEQRSNELIEQIEGRLAAKQELTNGEQQGSLESGKDTAARRPQ